MTVNRLDVGLTQFVAACPAALCLISFSVINRVGSECDLSHVKGYMIQVIVIVTLTSSVLSHLVKVVHHLLPMLLVSLVFFVFLSTRRC